MTRPVVIDRAALLTIMADPLAATELPELVPAVLSQAELTAALNACCGGHAAWDLVRPRVETLVRALRERRGELGNRFLAYLGRRKGRAVQYAHISCRFDGGTHIAFPVRLAVDCR